MNPIKDWRKQIGIALASGFLVALSFNFGLFKGLELFFEDLFVFSKPVDPRIVVLAIDNDSIQKIGQWPWPREVFAKAFLKMAEQPPKGVGFDVMLSEPSRLGLADDESLRLALAVTGKKFPVVFPVEGEHLRLEKNGLWFASDFLQPITKLKPPSYIKSESLAHVNLLPDNDSVVRRYPAFLALGDINQYSTFPIFAGAVIHGGSEPPIYSGNGRIVYSAPTGTIRRIPFWRILEPGSAALLKGKYVFIGSTAPDLHDDQITPFSRGVRMPGVEIHAQIANMLLKGYQLNELGKLWMTVLILVASLLSSAFFIKSRKPLTPLWSNVGMGVFLSGAAVVFFERGAIVNFIHLNLSWLLTSISLFAYRFFVVDKEKRQIRKFFTQYVSKEVLEEITKNPDAVQLGGAEREVTVFFSDIRGFTTLSEKTGPTDLVGILNRYFSAMTDEVLKHGGVIDKYIGDAIMAFWGAPVDDEKQADHALEASLAMLKRLEVLNREFQREGKPEIKIGIGLYSGKAVAGNIGSDKRFDYTVIGDTVNVASRLEGLNKEYKTQIILGETTKNTIRGKYDFKEIGEVPVKGRSQPVKIFTPTPNKFS